MEKKCETKLWHSMKPNMDQNEQQKRGKNDGTKLRNENEKQKMATQNGRKNVEEEYGTAMWNENVKQNYGTKSGTYKGKRKNTEVALSLIHI